MVLILHPPISIPSSSFTTAVKSQYLLLLHPKISRNTIKSKLEEQTNSNKLQQPKGETTERSSNILRREPFGNPSLTTPQQEARADELRKDESAFLIALGGLVAVIILEGIALAASGFLPEAWDKFLVKYLYPSFTPTVLLFLAGTVAYGVIKYLQNQNSNTE